MYEFGECRVMLGHRWDRVGPVEPGKKRNTWRVQLGCERCTTKKIVVQNGRGDITSRRYKPPQAYRLDKDYSRAALRKAVLTEWRKAS